MTGSVHDTAPIALQAHSRTRVRSGPRGRFITSWLEVRILPAPPRIHVFCRHVETRENVCSASSRWIKRSRYRANTPRRRTRVMSPTRASWDSSTPIWPKKPSTHTRLCRDANTVGAVSALHRSAHPSALAFGDSPREPLAEALAAQSSFSVPLREFDSDSFGSRGARARRQRMPTSGSSARWRVKSKRRCRMHEPG